MEVPKCQIFCLPRFIRSYHENDINMLDFIASSYNVDTPGLLTFPVPVTISILPVDQMAAGIPNSNLHYLHIIICIKIHGNAMEMS